MLKNLKIKNHLTSFQLIILGFAGVILLGALLLMLPCASRNGQVTPFFNALFTSTSAVCVTGLVVLDTGSYWTIFGQTVILLLIQVGGLGVITIAVTFAMLSGKKISLMQRSTMQNAISAPQVGGIVRLTRFIIKGTFLIEFVGAVIMLPTFCKTQGYRGIWMSVFHSISAFCNAGFDILGTHARQFISLAGYSGSVLVNSVIMLLIITGGIGFLTWEDIYIHRLHIKHYRLQSKLIIIMTAVLIVIPAVYFYLVDFVGMPMKERILCSLFQSVTTRTAGYNTADIAVMSGGSKAMMIVLMLIGGAPGSTAGGMKTTTFAVLAANAFATFRRRDNIQVFGRRISDEAVRNAATIAMLYVSMFFCGAVIISTVERIPFTTCLYETASAIGTVGLTLGITPHLGHVSKAILIVLMYFGRVGGLTLIYATVPGKMNHISRFPEEKITVG